MHRQALPRGRVAYEPNSLAGGCPFQAGVQGFVSFPEAGALGDRKVRAKPEKFAEHYAQATLFWTSQTPAEQRHIVGGFRFELSKVQVPAIRERMVASLRNVSEELAAAVAAGLGISPMPAPLPRAGGDPPQPEVVESPALSLAARPGPGNVRGRRVAVLALEGVDGDAVRQVQQALLAEQAVPRILASRLAPVRTAGGEPLWPDATLENSPSVLFDAVVLPEESREDNLVTSDALCIDFLKDQYRHGKPMLVMGGGSLLLDKAGIPPTLPDGRPDPALVLGPVKNALAQFLIALAGHRETGRETDPPAV
jgi:catalase